MQCNDVDFLSVRNLFSRSVYPVQVKALVVPQTNLIQLDAAVFLVVDILSPITGLGID